MGFKFKRGERFADGFVRVALEQTKRIERHLDEKERGAQNVHEARKCVKRMRALLRLARPAVGPKWWNEVDDLCSSVGSTLAGLRNLDSLLEALDKLAVVSGVKKTPTFDRFRASIQRERQGINEMSAAEAWGEVRDDLDVIRKRFKRVRFSERGFDIVGLGLALTCKEARRLEETAYATGNEHDFHRWRKRVQHHWRHMQLFNASWPEEMAVRAEAARELSEVLGDEHDLGLLAEEVRKRADELKNKRGADGLVDAAANRQQALRRLARERSRRLFAERGKAFSRRIRAYWKNPVDPLDEDGEGRQGTMQS